MFQENVLCCIYQEMFLNCPSQVSKTNEKEYKTTKRFVENKMKKEECGSKVEDKFLLDLDFWMGTAVEVEDAEDDQ